jgi:hypothetical protein
MSWLTEDSTIVLIIAVVVAAGLVLAFLKTGRGLYLLCLGGVILLAMVLVLIERYVVTDREQIEETLSGAAAAVEANDFDAALAYLAPNAELLHNDILRRLQRVNVEEATITDLSIDFSPLELPPKAIARFLGILKFEASGIPYDRILRRLTLKLAKHGDRWLIESYEIHNRL